VKYANRKWRRRTSRSYFCASASTSATSASPACTTTSSTRSKCFRKSPVRGTAATPSSIPAPSSLSSSPSTSRRTTERYISSTKRPTIPTKSCVPSKTAKESLPSLLMESWSVIRVSLSSAPSVCWQNTKDCATSNKWSSFRTTFTTASANNANSWLRRIKAAITWPVDVVISSAMSAVRYGPLLTMVITTKTATSLQSQREQKQLLIYHHLLSPPAAIADAANRPLERLLLAF